MVPLSLALVDDNILLLQSLVTTLFWLSIILAAILVFRKELRTLLSSIKGAKVAGASFEFQNQRQTLEFYATLSAIFLDILSTQSPESLVQFFSRSSAEQLARFSLKYTKEIPTEEVDMELVKNAAYIVGRWGLTDKAIAFYDALLKDRPDDPYLLAYKGLALLEGSEDQIRDAVKIYSGLIKKFPRDPINWINRASARGLLGEYDEGLADLKRAHELGMQPDSFNSFPGIQELRKARAQKMDEILNVAATS